MLTNLTTLSLFQIKQAFENAGYSDCADFEDVKFVSYNKDTNAFMYKAIWDNEESEQLEITTIFVSVNETGLIVAESSGVSQSIEDIFHAL